MSKRTKCLVFLVFSSLAGVQAEPIKVHPANPHYYLFNNRPTILITSAEHYGAVVNKDFNYVPYLDALQSYGLNYTRIYMGAMFEPQGKFIKAIRSVPNRGVSSFRGREATSPVTGSVAISLTSTSGTRSISRG